MDHEHAAAERCPACHQFGVWDGVDCAICGARTCLDCGRVERLHKCPQWRTGARYERAGHSLLIGRAAMGRPGMSQLGDYVATVRRVEDPAGRVYRANIVAICETSVRGIESRLLYIIKHADPRPVIGRATRELRALWSTVRPGSLTLRHPTVINAPTLADYEGRTPRHSRAQLAHWAELVRSGVSPHEAARHVNGEGAPS